MRRDGEGKRPGVLHTRSQQQPAVNIEQVVWRTTLADSSIPIDAVIAADPYHTSKLDLMTRTKNYVQHSTYLTWLDLREVCWGGQSLATTALERPIWDPHRSGWVSLKKMQECKNSLGCSIFFVQPNTIKSRISTSIRVFHTFKMTFVDFTRLHVKQHSIRFYAIQILCRFVFFFGGGYT